MKRDEIEDGMGCSGLVPSLAEKNVEKQEKQRLRDAFLAGAKFWEYHQSGGTMWQSDQQIVAEEAIKRY